MMTEVIHPSSVKPLVRFGESPHHITLSGPDGPSFSATYGSAIDKDNTMAMAYDLYYKGSLINSLSFAARGGLEGEFDPVALKAIVEADGSGISFADFYKTITHVGRGFCELGLNPFDRALVYVPTASRGNPRLPQEWLTACYGLWAFGMALIVVTTEAQLRDAVAEGRPRVVITSAEAVGLCAGIMGEASIEHSRIVLIGDGSAPASVTIPVTTIPEMAANGEKCQQEQQRTMFLPEPEHVAFVVYSSHTPGSGIVLTHGNLYAAATATKPLLVTMAAAQHDAKGTRDGKSLHTAVLEPFSHITPFVLASACLIAGGSVTFGLDGAVKSGNFVPTVIACSNATYGPTRARLGNKAPILHYNSVEDDLSKEVGVEVGDDIPFWYCPIAASGVGLMRVAHAHEMTLMPGAELRLRLLPPASSDGCDSLDVRRLGEVMLRGPFVSKGYYSADRSIGELDRSMLADGWLPTGDVAEMKPNGDIVILGRLRPSPDGSRRLSC